MYKFKIITKDKYMKRVQNIESPDTQRVGKIDISDILNSSIPNELHYIGQKRIKELKQGKSITIAIKTITVIHIQK
jgi:hypothetical protein